MVQEVIKNTYFFMNLYTKCLKYESFRVFFHELNILKTYFWGVVTLVIIVYIKLY